MRRADLAVCAITGTALALLTACSRPHLAIPAPEAWPACTNGVAGFAVTYPPDWKANPEAVMPACSLFDPGDVAVAPGTELPHAIAVVIVREDVPFSEAATGYRSVKVLREEPTVVAGKRALRFEIVDQEPISGEQPLQSYHYLIDLGKDSLVASVYAEGTLPYEVKRGVLDRMMLSLTLQP